MREPTIVEPTEKTLIEPTVAHCLIAEDRNYAIHLSIAISLKRIADSLEKLELMKDVAKLMSVIR